MANANGSATITALIQDDGDTANGGVNFFERTFTVTVTAVNDEPSFTKGADQTVLEDGGAQNVSGWGSAINAGPTNEAGQSLTFLVSNDNMSLFSAQPAIASSGTLTYTTAPDANGSATVTVMLQDSGGTDNFGVDRSAVQTFIISVTPVNDAPTLAAIADPAAILEEAGAQTVNLSGISAGGGESQTLAVTVTSDNPGLIANPSVTYASADATGSLSYTPAANASGSSVITVSVQDNGGTANSGVNFIERSFTVNVTAIHDPATLANIEGSALSYTENETNSITATLTVSQGDNASLTRATISITDHYVASEDVLGFTDQNGISGSFDDITGLLTLSGSSSVANYELALRSVTYQNSSDNPTVTTRTVSFKVNDGLDESNVATRDITINTVNDAPLAVDDALVRKQNRSTKIAVSTLLENDSDLEGDSLTVTAVNSPSSNGATIILDGSWVIYNAPAGFNSADAFTYSLNDGFGGSATGTVSVTVVMADNSSSQNTISMTTDGADVIVRFAGIPEREYTVQYTTDLVTPSWITLGSRSAGSNGVFEFRDVAPGDPERFYRTVGN
jgi:hypothetical protein